MANVFGIVAVLMVSISFAYSQTQAVTLCPLYLVLQNRCPNATTTVAPSTGRTTTVSGANDSSEADVVDSCGLPVITFCPDSQSFLNGDRNCTSGQTIQIKMTTLGRLLVSPSFDRAARAVGSSSVNALGDAFTSMSKAIQETPTQATIGVTFIPVGQIIG